MKSFFEDQRSRIEKAINSRYDEAAKVRDSVNTYLENQQKKISDDLNKYVESVKSSGKQVSDSWSYLPIEEPGARMSNPDIELSVPSIISRNGFNCDTHIVESQGYLLNVHRIRLKCANSFSKKTVILHHGLFGSSADWIINGPDKGLAYTLTMAGYDVWIPNIRGNRYSKEHATLKRNSKSFWNFSWHDVALYDIPAIIDYILRLKEEGTKIAYIGHSMGTTILFVMLTLRPEYNNILSGGIALSPVAFFSDLKSPLKSLAPSTSNVAYMEMLYGSHEFVPKKSVLGRMASGCNIEHIDSMVCKNIIFYICGANEKQCNKALLPVFMAHFATGTSWKTIVHFSQQVLNGEKFQQFDYGASHNQRVYGSDVPPEYDLSKITLPISLFWSENDLLSSEKDVHKLYEKLSPTTKMYKVPDPSFNHTDYLLAIDAATLVNVEVLETLNKYF